MDQDTQRIEDRIRHADEMAQSRLETALARIDGTFARIDGTFARMDARFEKMDARFEARSQELDARFEKMDARFEKLETKIDARFEIIQSDIASLKNNVSEFRSLNQQTRNTVVVTGIGTVLAILGLLIGLKQVWIGGVQVGLADRAVQAAPAVPGR